MLISISQAIARETWTLRGPADERCSSSARHCPWSASGPATCPMRTRRRDAWKLRAVKLVLGEGGSGGAGGSGV